jgi:hypothetical protein
VLKTTPLHLKWLFSLWPLNFWYLTIRSLMKKNLFFFLNVTPGSNCNWTPKFQSHLQISTWFSI